MYKGFYELNFSLLIKISYIPSFEKVCGNASEMPDLEQFGTYTGCPKVNF